MNLPKNEAVFDFEQVGEVTDKKYEGTFTTLCVLNMVQKHALELMKTRLLGDHVNPTDGLAGISTVLATLRAKIIEGPEWWKQGLGSDLLDEDVLVALYNKVQEAETTWRTNLKEQGKKAQEQQPTTSPQSKQ